MRCRFKYASYNNNTNNNLRNIGKEKFAAGEGFWKGIESLGAAEKEVTSREPERSRDLFGKRPAHYIVLSFKLNEYLLDRRWDHGRI